MNTQTKNALYVFRQRRGISASNVADLVGVSRQTIYAIEAGQYVPNTVIALRLAHVLGTTVETLFWIEKSATPVRTDRVAVSAKKAPFAVSQSD
jgi:DNA-binding XRE family transcriptional regulator